LTAATLGATGFLTGTGFRAGGAFLAVVFFAGSAFREGADLLVPAIRLSAAEPAAMDPVPAFLPLFLFAGTRTVITNLQGALSARNKSGTRDRVEQEKSA
jgi:hypothetical protein